MRLIFVFFLFCPFISFASITLVAEQAYFPEDALISIQPTLGYQHINVIGPNNIQKKIDINFKNTNYAFSPQTPGNYQFSYNGKQVIYQVYRKPRVNLQTPSVFDLNEPLLFSATKNSDYKYRWEIFYRSEVIHTYTKSNIEFKPNQEGEYSLKLTVKYKDDQINDFFITTILRTFVVTNNAKKVVLNVPKDVEELTLPITLVAYAPFGTNYNYHWSVNNKQCETLTCTLSKTDFEQNIATINFKVFHKGEMVNELNRIISLIPSSLTNGYISERSFKSGNAEVYVTGSGFLQIDDDLKDRVLFQSDKYLVYSPVDNIRNNFQLVLNNKVIDTHQSYQASNNIDVELNLSKNTDENVLPALYTLSLNYQSVVRKNIVSENVYLNNQLLPKSGINNKINFQTDVLGVNTVRVEVVLVGGARFITTKNFEVSSLSYPDCTLEYDSVAGEVWSLCHDSDSSIRTVRFYTDKFSTLRSSISLDMIELNSDITFEAVDKFGNMTKLFFQITDKGLIYAKEKVNDHISN